MGSKFLNSGVDSGLTDGSASINIFDITIQSLLPSMPIKTSASKQLTSTLLNTADTVGLDSALVLKDDLTFNEGAAAGTPAAGTTVIYAKTDGNMYQKTDAGVEMRLAGGGVDGVWDFDDTVGGVPAVNDLTFDNATPLNVTEIKVNETDSDGNNMRPLLQSLSMGDSIFLCNAARSNCKYYSITDSNDSGAYFTIDVAIEDQSDVANFVNTELLNVVYYISSNPFDQSLNTTDFPSFAGLTSDSGLIMGVIATPAAPATGGHLYVKNDGLLHMKQAGGNDLIVSNTSGASTGLISGGVISIGTGGAGVATTFSITAGGATFVTTDAFGTGEIVTQKINWTVFTDVSVTNIATQVVTYVCIDSTGSIVQLPATPSNTQLRSLTFVGIVRHEDLATVQQVGQSQSYAVSPMSQLRDFANAVGKLNTEGNQISGFASLQFLKSAGKMFALDLNFTISESDPSIVSTGEINTSTSGMFAYGFQDGSTSVFTLTDIDPNLLDTGSFPGGTYPNNQFGTSRCYLFPSNLLLILPPQTSYGSLAAAEDAILTETFIVDAEVLANGLLIAFIVTKGNATSLQNLSDTLILNATKFGAAGSSSIAVSTLQTSYDNSIQPQIITDATRNAVVFQGGSGNNADNTTEHKNNAGTIVSSITGNGLLDTVAYSEGGDAGVIIRNALGGSGNFNMMAGGTYTNIEVGAFTNLAIGPSALNAITVGDGNLALGRDALSLITTGSTNIGLGFSAGNTLTTGFGNTCLGYDSDCAATLGNQIAIGHTAVATVANSCVIGNAALTHIRPEGTCDLGTTGKPFADLFLNGSIVTTGISVEDPAPIITLKDNNDDAAFASVSIIFTDQNDVAIGSIKYFSEDLVITNDGSGAFDNIIFSCAGDIIPNVTATNDLGTDTSRYKDLYLSGNADIGGQAWSTTTVLTDAVTIATDCDLGNVNTVTLTANRTLGAPTNMKDGAKYMWIIKQDAGGTNTLAYNAVFLFPGGVAPVLSTGGNAIDILTGVSDGTSIYCTMDKDFS